MQTYQNMIGRGDTMRTIAITFDDSKVTPATIKETGIAAMKLMHKIASERRDIGAADYN